MQQLNILEHANHWFNQLPVWEQLKYLFETLNVKEKLAGKTQADKVLWHLETFGRITNMQCHELYGIRHAPSVIRDLRERFEREKSPYCIKNEPAKEGCNRFGEPCKWDVYVLTQKEQQCQQ
jgi:hypothetical protein